MSSKSSSTPAQQTRIPINNVKPHRSSKSLDLDLKVSNSRINKAPDARESPNVLRLLTKQSKNALRNLLSFRFSRLGVGAGGGAGGLQFPRSKCAAVLVALFVGRKGDLYVLLSKRATHLRSYAGDTALPGGKVEMDDTSFEEAARREAFEEVEKIGLPIDTVKVPLLCQLEPFVAGNGVVVTPVVVLILDNSLKPTLQPTEVQSLFSHPLISFLSEVPPYPNESELDQLPYHSWDDTYWDGPPIPVSAHRENRRHRRGRSGSTSQEQIQDIGQPSSPTTSQTKWMKRTIRMHRFLTGREAGGIKPVFGLTAAILLRTAMIAYPHLANPPPFEIQPPTAPTWNERIAWVMWKNRREWSEKAEEEGISIDWNLVGRIAGVSQEERKGALNSVAKSKL